MDIITIIFLIAIFIIGFILGLLLKTWKRIGLLFLALLITLFLFTIFGITGSKNVCGLLLVLIAAGFFGITLIIFGIGLVTGAIVRKIL